MTRASQVTIWLSHDSCYYPDRFNGISKSDTEVVGKVEFNVSGILLAFRK